MSQKMTEVNFEKEIFNKIQNKMLQKIMVYNLITSDSKTNEN